MSIRNDVSNSYSVVKSNGREGTCMLIDRILATLHNEKKRKTSSSVSPSPSPYFSRATIHSVTHSIA